MSLKDLFEKYSIEQLLNIILVKKNIRNGYLFEPHDLKDNEIEDLLDLALQNNLIVRDFKGAILISKEKAMNKFFDNKNIGEFLGYICKDHEYFYDENIPRYLLHFIATYKNKDYILYSQMCDRKLISYNDLNDYAISQIEIMNNKIQLDDLLFTYSLIKTSTKKERYDALIDEDIKYLTENFDEYLNDLFNYFCVGNLSTKLENDIKSFDIDFQFYKKFWKKYVIDNIGRTFNLDGNEINDIMSRLDILAYNDGNSVWQILI